MNIPIYLLFFLLMLAGFEDYFSKILPGMMVLSLVFVCPLAFSNLLTLPKPWKRRYLIIPSLLLLFGPMKIVYAKPEFLSLYLLTLALAMLLGFWSELHFLKRVYFLKSFFVGLLWALPISVAPSLLAGYAWTSNLRNFSVTLLIVSAVDILRDLGPSSSKYPTLASVYGLRATQYVVTTLLILASALLFLFRESLIYQAALIPPLLFTGFAHEKRGKLYFDSILFTWILVELLMLALFAFDA